jgi:hypothetical protein
MFGSVTMSEDTSSLGEALSSCMKIDSVKDNKIYLRNCGTGVVRNDSTSVYMDEAPIIFTMTPSSIGKGQIAEITLNSLFGVSIGNHKIRISNKAGEIQRYIKAVLPDSCILDLEFDEGSGTIAHDSSKYHNDGRLFNSPIWVDGKAGKALDFDGNNYVNVSSSEDFKTLTITVSAWIYPKELPSDDGVWKYILVRSENLTLPTYKHFRFGINYNPVNTLYFNLWNSSGDEPCLVNSNDVVPKNQWSYVAAGFNGTHCFIFLNGKKYVGQENNSFIQYYINQDFTVARRPGTPSNVNFNGTIDNVRIYNKALNPDETVALTLGELT